MDDDLEGLIFDEEDEPGPTFEVEAPSVTSIIMKNQLCFDPDTTPTPLSTDIQEHCEKLDLINSLPEMFVKISSENLKQSVDELEPAEVRVDELDELSDTTLELDELSNTILELSKLSDTEDGAGLAAERNGSCSAQGKVHKKCNTSLFFAKFDQPFLQSISNSFLSRNI
ncbi:hypothetical protein YC2023_073245 [Brassica napus]